MNEIFQGEILSLYSQIGLFDKENKNSYPEWITGEENAIIASRGVAVATKGDSKIKVIVSTDIAQKEKHLLITGTIKIGRKGFIVGNIPAADLYHVDFPAGKVYISVYANGIRNAATKIIFILTPSS
jgi:hypothetical protein